VSSKKAEIFTRTAEAVIDGHRYGVTTLPFWTGLPIFGRLAKILLRSLPALAAGKVDSKDQDGAMALMADIAAAADENRFAEDLRVLFSTLTYDGRELGVTTDDHFSGRYMLAMQVAWFAIAENFRDFLGPGGVVNFGLKAESAPSPSTES
jgi:hypothetical protein